MYKIIGADGQQYGPVTAAQVRSWFAENRIRKDTLLQAEGSAEWKPLSSFPEFADLVGGSAAGAPPPLTPPPVTPPPPNPDELVAEVLARQPRIDASYCLSRGWKLVTQDFWLTVGVSFVILLVAGVPLLHGPAYAGLFWFFLKKIRGQQPKFEDAFAPFSVAFLQTFLGGIVISLLVAAGTMLCIIPGLIFAALWTFTWPLMMDKRLDFWPAMEVSRRVLWANFGGIVALLLLSILVMLLGICACGVGYCIAFPVVIAAMTYAYEDFFGAQNRPRFPAASGV